jgi:hypothetical protein
MNVAKQAPAEGHGCGDCSRQRQDGESDSVAPVHQTPYQAKYGAENAGSAHTDEEAPHGNYVHAFARLHGDQISASIAVNKRPRKKKARAQTAT